MHNGAFNGYVMLAYILHCVIYTYICIDGLSSSMKTKWKKNLKAKTGAQTWKQNLQKL